MVARTYHMEIEQAMNDKIDFVKLLEQDERFAEYVKETLYKQFMSDKAMQETLPMLYAYYTSGMGSDFMSKLTKLMKAAEAE